MVRISCETSLATIHMWHSAQTLSDGLAPGNRFLYPKGRCSRFRDQCEGASQPVNRALVGPGSWDRLQLWPGPGPSDQWSGNRVRKLRLWPEIIRKTTDCHSETRDQRVEGTRAGARVLQWTGYKWCCGVRGTFKTPGWPNYLENLSNLKEVFDKVKF